MSLLSVRSVIVPLLAAGLVAGCDRQEAATGQANASATAAAPAAPTVNEAAPVPGEAGQVDRSHKGAAAPALGFFDANGKPTSLAAFRGRPVLLNLWATWCAPCLKEMPTLDALAAGFTVVAVSQDDRREGQARAARYLLEKGLRHLRLFTDPEIGLSTAMQANLPTSVLYDAQGREVWRVAGAMDWSGPAARALLKESK